LILDVLALVLALLAPPGEAVVEAPGDAPLLNVDPCVDVDAAEVRRLLELELRDVRARDQSAALAVGVRCTPGGQEIRVEPWASLGQDGIRTIELPPQAKGDTASREARGRELAVAIAELVRRLHDHALVRREPPPPPPPIRVAPAQPPEQPRSLRHIGVVSSFDYFMGRQLLVGGEATLSVALGRYMLADVSAGVRTAGDQALPSGRLATRAGTGAIALGPNLGSLWRLVGVALLFRARGYLVEYRAAPANDGAARTARFGAVFLAAEPRLSLRLSRRISLLASAAVELPVHGIVVRAQGVETASISGLALAVGLGTAMAF
jgi:hypothetical protein